MADHQKFVNLALRLIKKHGRMTSFRIVSNASANPDKPWQGTATAPESVGPLPAVFLPFRGFEFGSLFTTGDLNKEVDEICMVAGDPEGIEHAHVVIDEGKDYKIQWVQRLRPADKTILYAFGINR